MKNDNNDFEKQREIDAFLEQFNNNEDENLTEYNKNIKNDVNNRFDKISDEFGKSVNHGNDYEPEYSKRKESEEDLWKELDEPGQWNEQPEKKSSHRRKPNKQITSMKSKTNNKKHNIKTGKKHNTKKRIILKTLLAGFSVCVLAGCILLGVVITTAPEINAKSIYESLGENSVMYDKDGEMVDSIMTQNGLRTNITYDQMPKNLVDAFVAIEDKTFWEHHGFNIIRIGGAIVDGIKNDGRIKGTSTITQQLARNIYLADSKSNYSMVRKVKEAYYAVVIERELTKKQILEAYANTIYLGFHANGVQAASQEYFSKDVSELNLQECAAIASLPQGPDRFALIKQYSNEDIQPNNPNILVRTNDFTLVYNDSVEHRKNLVLKNMYEQKKISKAEYEAAKNANLKDSIKPNLEKIQTKSSYFADYVLDNVISDLMKNYKISRNEAKNMIYNNGLKIYSTMDSKAQNIVETQFSKSSNFPNVASVRKDRNGNVISDKGKVLLYSESLYFDKQGNFVFNPDEYRYLSNGNLLLCKGKRLNFYKTSYGGKIDYSIEFKSMHSTEGGVFYSTQGGVVNIPRKYKSVDKDGNLIIKKSFLKENPSFFNSNGNTIYIGPETYTLRQKVRQPQGAMVIIDHSNGEVRAMVGGRNTQGKSLYNRAVNPRQPGSSIKPICVYAPALQTAVDKLDGNGDGGHSGDSDENPNKLGSYWTAVSVINDSPIKKNGKNWPKNWYHGYKGEMSLRTAVEQSVNTVAVKVLMEIGETYSIKFAKGLGISTIVENGTVNDMTPAALALGGMSQGISPMEMAAAYGAFADQGTYRKPISYTKVLNRKGEVILKNKSKSHKAMDAGVAFIMSDILKTTVSEGLGKAAQIGVQTVYGKTGTTTDNFDAWFVGFTPTYTAALWIGNDVNIQLSTGSGAAAKLWSVIMKQVCSGLPNKSMTKPDNVVSSNAGNGKTEYFIKGTQTKLHLAPETREVQICQDSGCLATPWCTHKVMKSLPVTLIPKYYCHLHNLDPNKYPINPANNLEPSVPSDSTDSNSNDSNTQPSVPTPPVTPPPAPPSP